MENKVITNILVPTDFSECADNAMQAAIAVAKFHKARLTLVHVVAPIPELYGLEEDRATKEQQQELLETQTERISIIAAALREEQGLFVGPLIRIGQTITQICETVAELNIDLVIMGTHGIRGFREFLIGSNTYGVTEKSRAPVLSIPLSSKIYQFKKIMFPVRNIPNALEKYLFLKTFMGRNTPKLVVYGIYKIDDTHLATAYKRVSLFVKDIRKEWSEVKVASVITEENLADEVLERAIEMRCDLIVITAKVGKSIKDFFLGKFAQQMVNHSTLPVLHIK
ncbi:MAG: universal stress protein [Phormidesmis sp. FL-bin-119]|nr:universal stress protein [Pedobacter sp.]